MAAVQGRRREVPLRDAPARGHGQRGVPRGGPAGSGSENHSTIAGTDQARSRAAILFDWDSWWASELDSHPTDRLRYRQEALDWYTAFLANGVPADVVPVSASLDGYDLVVAPILHLVPSSLATRLSEYVAGGGHLVTTYFSGIVNEDDHIWLGGYPARCATCSASGSRSSGRCSRATASHWTTARTARSGPTGST